MPRHTRCVLCPSCACLSHADRCLQSLRPIHANQRPDRHRRHLQRQGTATFDTFFGITIPDTTIAIYSTFWTRWELVWYSVVWCGGGGVVEVVGLVSGGSVVGGGSVVMCDLATSTSF